MESRVFNILQDNISLKKVQLNIASLIPLSQDEFSDMLITPDTQECLFIVEHSSYKAVIRKNVELLKGKWIYLTNEKLIPYEVISDEPFAIIAYDDITTKLEMAVRRFFSSYSESLAINSKHTIELPLLNGLVTPIEVQDVIYVKSQGNFSEVLHRSSLKSDKLAKKVVNCSLKTMEQLLSTPSMFRIHKSYIVNLEWVLPFENYPKASVQIKNSNINLPLAKRRKLEFTLAYRAFAKANLKISDLEHK